MHPGSRMATAWPATSPCTMMLFPQTALQDSSCASSVRRQLSWLTSGLSASGVASKHFELHILPVGHACAGALARDTAGDAHPSSFAVPQAVLDTVHSMGGVSERF